MKRLICAAALAASATVAEEKATAPAAPAKMEMPKPPEQMSVEKWFVGSWSCKGHQNAGPMGPPADTNNKIVFTMELGGFWLQYKGSAQAGPMNRRGGIVSHRLSGRSFPVTQCTGASKCVPVCSPIVRVFQYHAGPLSS